MMKYSGKKSEKNYGESILIGLGVMMLCVVLAAMVVATFIISGTVAESKMEVIAVAALFISAVIGSFTVRSAKGQGGTKAILIFAGCNIALILLSNLIFSKGVSHNFLLKMGFLIVGSAAELLNNKNKTKKYKKVINR